MWKIVGNSANYTNYDICIGHVFENIVCVCTLFWKYVLNLCISHCFENAGKIVKKIEKLWDKLKNCEINWKIVKYIE